MKKLMSLFVIIASLTFVACESDSSTTDDSNNNNNSGGNTSNVFLTKLIDTDDSNGDVVTTNFFYNGTKLNYVTDDDAGLNNKSVFTYTNDLITAINYYSDNVLTIKDEYTYDSSSRLIQHKQFDYTDSGTINHEYKFTFVYNSNNTINFELYSISPSGTDLESSGVINLDANQNVTSNTVTDGFTGDIKTYTYTYDNKNNPYKNIIGLDKIRYTWPSTEIDGSVLNNVLNINKNTNPYLTTTYTYNSLNFPATSNSNEDGETFNTQYFYN